MQRTWIDAICGALYAALVVVAALLVSARFGHTYFWAVVGAGAALVSATFAAKPSLVTTPFAACAGATAGVLAAPLLANIIAPPPAPVSPSLQTLESLVEMSQRDPLVAVATAWHPVRSAAVVGSWPVGPRLEAGRTYGLVAVASTHGPGGPAPSAADERRFTREGFTRAWQAVDEDGSLAWLAADETVFARGVAQIADVVVAETRSAVPLANRAFALRVTDSAPATPYRFLLLVWRSSPGAEDAMRLASLAHALPVRVLFGTGVPARGAWTSFADPRGVGFARDVLRLDLSRRAGEWLDLSSTTAERPTFLRLKESGAVATRALTGVSTIGLLAILLLPLGKRRAIDSPLAPAWPLPLALAAFAAAGAAPFFAIAALSGHTVALGGRAIVLPVVAIAGALVGFAGGARIRNARSWIALTLIGAALAAVLRMALGPLATGPLSSEAAREVLVAAAAGAFGVSAAAALSGARARLLETMPDVVPWAIRAHGLAAFGAAAASPWLVQWKGFSASWVAATIAYLGAAAAAPLLRDQSSSRM